MKINMILPALGHSGGVQMATDYLNYFVEQGNDVVCYVPFTGAYYGWKRILFPKAIYRLLKSKDLQGKWLNNKFVIKFVPYINNLWVRNSDITIATSWLTSYWVYNLNSSKGKKVYFIQDFETWGNDKENKLVRTSYHLPFDARIVVSTSLYDKLMCEEGIESEVICNGVRDIFLEEGHRGKNSKVTIGMPYRKQRGELDLKNCKLGLAALSLFNKDKYNIKLYGFDKPIGLRNDMEFLVNPSVRELIEWYDSVDVFYVPSLYEGWGLPAMEAMARGCVVLGAKVGCLYEFGENKYNFIQLSNMKDINEVKERIKELSSSPEEIEKIGKNAREAIKKYSFSNQANSFLNRLESLAE